MDTRKNIHDQNEAALTYYKAGISVLVTRNYDKKNLSLLLILFKC